MNVSNLIPTKVKPTILKGGRTRAGYTIRKKYHRLNIEELKKENIQSLEQTTNYH
jgi:hypothetical protein